MKLNGSKKMIEWTNERNEMTGKCEMKNDMWKWEMKNDMKKGNIHKKQKHWINDCKKEGMNEMNDMNDMKWMKWI